MPLPAALNLIFPLPDPPLAGEARRQTEKYKFSLCDCRNGGECWSGILEWSERSPSPTREGTGRSCRGPPNRHLSCCAAKIRRCTTAAQRRDLLHPAAED